jgi:Lon protease-like protein
MVCPFSPNEKQALLEAADPSERARTLIALMEMGSLQAGDAGDRPRH